MTKSRDASWDRVTARIAAAEAEERRLSALAATVHAALCRLPGERTEALDALQELVAALGLVGPV